MIQKCDFLIILLVIVSMEFAHVKTMKQINDTTVLTSSIINNNNTEYPVKKGDTLYQMKSSIQENRLTQTFSVVQDWNLVCKQLCGAGLGGPTCGHPKCEEIKNSQPGNITQIAKRLLQAKEDFICEDLCKYGLGGDICTCPPKLLEISGKESRSIKWDRNQVCYTFCLHNEITLIGCSLCTKVNPTDIVSTPKPEPPQSTTPDWKEICNELCKTGDGGALCNCDKPPFF